MHTTQAMAHETWNAPIHIYGQNTVELFRGDRWSRLTEAGSIACRASMLDDPGVYVQARQAFQGNADEAIKRHVTGLEPDRSVLISASPFEDVAAQFADHIDGILLHLRVAAGRTYAPAGSTVRCIQGEEVVIPFEIKSQEIVRVESIHAYRRRQALLRGLMRTTQCLYSARHPVLQLLTSREPELLAGPYRLAGSILQ